ncbi:MarR family winged helix-turn-helix transcriptional regulator [Noviherbaspirillum pedocola]|uniref:MarR family transcriptional regulator n=1 Tax=Noviherbaspirillum pedocola TaxID=2801341 RepID=A0A934W8I8_9BURK|nr:MarR family transcriptional regulator [Noviherbaspirillum pedocola]MBK4738687.1 MarR family transcriptional regulator [Noviherbaspirillum pedocola]
MAFSIEERFSAALYHASRAWRQAIDRRLKDLGIGQAGWMAIAVVAAAGEPLPQTELARRLGVENPTLVVTIDRLTAGGLAVRVPSSTDRRIKLVALTEAGTKLYEKVKSQADQVRNELLAHIDKDHLQLMTELLESVREKAESAP